MAKRKPSLTIAKTRRRKPATRRSARVENPGKLATVLVIAATVFFLLYISKNHVFTLAILMVSISPTEGDFAGSLIHESINLHHSIQENPNNKERLLERLTDPVIWYGKKPRSHDQLRFGSVYDKFDFITPLEFDERDFPGNNYEVRFDGMYRYRNPKQYLVAFESGSVIIQSGKIAQLSTYKKPNQYRHTWINTLYRFYPLCILLVSLTSAILFANISHIPQDLVNWLITAIRRATGM